MVPVPDPDIREKHDDMIRNLLKPGEQMLRELNVEDMVLLHLSCRLMEAAGKVADAVKRSAIYRDPLNVSALVDGLALAKVSISALKAYEHGSVSETADATDKAESVVCPDEYRAELRTVGYVELSAIRDYIAHVLQSLTPEKASMLHMAMANVADSGELLEAFTKWIFEGSQLDTENAIEELGDGAFFRGAICQHLGVTHDQVLQHNFNKLEKRYRSKKYSNEQAVARADKQEGEL